MKESESSKSDAPKSVVRKSVVRKSDALKSETPEKESSLLESPQMESSSESLWFFPPEENAPNRMDTNTRNLMEKYKSLDFWDRITIDTCAYACCSLNQSTLGACVYSFMKTQNGGTSLSRNATQENVSKALKRLKKQAFFLPTKSSYTFDLSANFVVALFLQKFQEGKFFEEIEPFRGNFYCLCERNAPHSSCLSSRRMMLWSALDSMFQNRPVDFQKCWEAYISDVQKGWYSVNHLSRETDSFFVPLFESPFDPTVYNGLNPEIQKMYVFYRLKDAVSNLKDLPKWIECAVERYISTVVNRARTDPFTLFYIQYLILRRQNEKILQFISVPKFNPILKHLVEAAFTFFDGNLEAAGVSFGNAEQLELAASRKKHEFPPFFEFLHILCGFHQDRIPWSWIDEVLKRNVKNDGGWCVLNEISFFVLGSGTDVMYKSISKDCEETEGVPTLFVRLIIAALPIWCNEKEDQNAIVKALKLAESVQKKTPISFKWVKEQAESVIENLKILLEQKGNGEPQGMFASLIRKKSRWDSLRSVLMEVGNPSSTDAKERPSNSKRLTWRFYCNDKNEFSLEPFEQSQKARGAWSAGRKVAMSRLSGNIESFDYLTPQDVRISHTIKVSTEYYYGASYSYSFDRSVFPLLVNHPLLFDRDHPEKQITITESQPILEVVDKNGKSILRIRPFPDFCQGKSEFLQVVRTSPDSYEIYKFDKMHLQIAEILKNEGLPVPKDQEKEVGEILEPVISRFKLNVASKTSKYISESAAVKNVEPDSRIHLFLDPQNEVLEVKICVFPMGMNQGECRPAAGMETIFWQNDGQTCSTERSFPAESRNLRQILDACPIFSQAEKENDVYHFQNSEDSFEFLAELETFVDRFRTPKTEAMPSVKKRKTKKKSKNDAVAEESETVEVVESAQNAQTADFSGTVGVVKTSVEPNASDASGTLQIPLTEELTKDAPLVIHWPKGKKTQVSSVTSFKNLRLGIQAVGGWFEASGSISVGNEEVELAQLLLAMDRTQSRFVEIRPNEFLSLSSQFRQKLDEFRTYSKVQGNHLKIHPLAAQAVETAFETAIPQFKEYSVVDSWKTNLHRFQTANEQTVNLPKTFQGNLRDYQLEGFQWLSRLSAWGAGGCLADDMGLGKTIQSIAILLSRAKLGPALVVAPTSVCANWEREIQRFAPSLNVVRIVSYVETGKIDRSSLIRSGKAMDVLITNYALLQREAEAFEKPKFATIILDEAQAIKNYQAERTQAVLQLHGDFRFITTGTPIENNLSELWSLFEFINPGFLGSKTEFDRNFGTPIQKNESQTAKNRLKRLIRPFVLRRFKSDVLSELPPKTEIQLEVDLSDAEMALYEGIRKNALKMLDSLSNNNKSGAQRIQVLAELMKLRRACCHPKLALSSTNIPSSKLEAITNTTQELLQNNHKILIFSQFVDYLHLIAEHFDEVGISYQYLDGSMTQKKRQQAIDAFQTGDDGVFLISLKAGGMGLNLTAADYVIHADPWWNPAVESQASDRAHRIGQTRPVTIYRMIAKGTIEEKILELHEKKRQLVQDILGDSSTPTSVSLEELLNLLKF